MHRPRKIGDEISQDCRRGVAQTLWGILPLSAKGAIGTEGLGNRSAVLDGDAAALKSAAEMVRPPPNPLAARYLPATQYHLPCTLGPVFTTVLYDAAR